MISNKPLIIKITYGFILTAMFLIYPILNERGENARIIKFSIDDSIPFVPIFSIPYILYFPFLIITLIYFICFTKFDKSIFIAFTFCLLVAYLTYFFYHTYILRAEIKNLDFFSELVLYIYSKDHPYNCLPSLHNALSILSFFYWVQILKKFKWIIGIFVLLIILSTLLIKQHYIPDVISGILLAIISFRISCYLSKKNSSEYEMN